MAKSPNRQRYKRISNQFNHIAMDFKHTIIIVILSIALIIFFIGFITGMLQNKKLMKHLSNQYEKLKTNKEVIDRLTSENGLLADSVVSLHSKNAILETDAQTIRATLSDTVDDLSQKEKNCEYWKNKLKEAQEKYKKTDAHYNAAMSANLNFKEENRRLKIKATAYENRSKKQAFSIILLTKKLLDFNIEFQGVEYEKGTNNPKPIFKDLDFKKP